MSNWSADVAGAGSPSNLPSLRRKNAGRDPGEMETDSVGERTLARNAENATTSSALGSGMPSLRAFLHTKSKCAL